MRLNVFDCFSKTVFLAVHVITYSVHFLINHASSSWVPDIQYVAENDTFGLIVCFCLLNVFSYDNAMATPIETGCFKTKETVFFFI